LSIPHSGTHIPDAIRDQYHDGVLKEMDDTDWFLDQLYDFAGEEGIWTIKANYSRWVIDLNRDPESKPLYDDGRQITALTPLKTFSGKDIYNSEGPDDAEIKKRLDTFYWPYYDAIQNQIQELKKDFPHVLLWDAHSIRHKIPSIQLSVFPELILGDNDKRSAHPALISKAIELLGSSGYSFAHNHPFKGGHITRYFGNPSDGIHALQLEMSKLNYMNKSETKYNEIRASQIKSLLKSTLYHLSNIIQVL
jgi:N-formylglutamate deformylase